MQQTQQIQHRIPLLQIGLILVCVAYDSANTFAHITILVIMHLCDKDYSECEGNLSIVLRMDLQQQSTFTQSKYIILNSKLCIRVTSLQKRKRKRNCLSLSDNQNGVFVSYLNYHTLKLSFYTLMVEAAAPVDFVPNNVHWVIIPKFSFLPCTYIYVDFPLEPVRDRFNYLFILFVQRRPKHGKYSRYCE